MEDIKKAFETMKKELKKETGIEGGFVMNQKQIKNRTATYLACNAIEYDEEIRRAEESDRRVQGYDTWTDEQKARHHEDTLKTVARYQERKARYGTKVNEAKVQMEAIENSKAFAEFQKAVGKTTLEFEMREGWLYYIRFRY